MKILLLNPNMTEAVTERLAGAARLVLSPGTQLQTATAPRGFPYISSRAEAQVAGAIALEMLAERQGQHDAAIIAAFGDPGLFGARELFDVPVIGMSEAAMLTACMLGKRFGIVSFAAQMAPWYEECVESHGLMGRCAGIFCLREAFTSIIDVAAEKQEALVALAGEAVAQGADVVILAGAPLAGLAREVAAHIPVPLVDQVQAAVRQAETLAALAPLKARTGGFRRPPAKPAAGLAPELAARFEHRD
ncbi:MAG: aspartate/glutamate racemase family protein [Beijerinckiaceae bacterium]|nr:aspartate/glutamate racemase family protein [Beijerinckiaceae bacterium]